MHLGFLRGEGAIPKEEDSASFSSCGVLICLLGICGGLPIRAVVDITTNGRPRGDPTNPYYF